MTPTQLEDKFTNCATFAPRPIDVDRVIATVERLETLPDLSQLLAAL